jgi:O-antigen ligase
LTVEAFVEGAASLGAVGTAGAALIIDAPRARARTMVAAMFFAAVALEPQVWPRLSDQVEGRPAIAAAGGVALALLVAALALAIRRRPAWLGLLVFVALPFRVPLTIGGDTANLLAPLYVVILAGCLAVAFGREELPDVEAPKALRRLDGVLALVLILYAGQGLYSSDLEQAVKNICFFYVPFALLYRLLRQVPWTRELLTRCLYVIVGLALFFAAIGFVEFATKHLLISNVKVLRANEIKPYFRVNSLFFDPNIYGRFLALTMVALATRLLWSSRARDNALIAAALAVLWAGLVLSLSQSSFAALLVGLAVLAALRWKAWPVVAITGAGVAVGLAVALIAPGTLHLDGKGKSVLDSATSGRADLVSGGWRMFTDRPIWGYGAGGFEQTYREREHVRSKRIAAISHTIPITVAAEQGVIGLLAYLARLVVALALLFGGLRSELRAARAPPALLLVRVICAAAFCALLVHTLVYASFLEDPVTWVLLGLAAALRVASRETLSSSS